MRIYLGKRLCPLIVLGLAACATTPAAVRQVAYEPPPPTTPTQKPPICARPEETDAFKVLALQTQMMQIAITCGEDDKYDVFVRQTQPRLEAERAVLKSFFTRAYGRYRAQTNFDQYVTQLADAESDYNLRSGDEFCKMSGPVLDQASTVSSPDDLTKFVAKVPVQQSWNVQTCGTPGAPPVALESTPVRRRAIYRHRVYRKAK